VSSCVVSLLPYRVLHYFVAVKSGGEPPHSKRKTGSSKEEPADISCVLRLLFDGFLHHGELQFGLGQ
jgi:hypothetical protein